MVNKDKTWKCVKGSKLSEKTIQKIREPKLGEKNPNWKGDWVGDVALHNWIRRHKPKSEICECCGQPPKYKISLDLANISQQYKRDITDFEWLCRSCHMKKDNRLALFIKDNREKAILANSKRKDLWNKDEVDFLIKNYGIMAKKDIAKILNKSLISIYKQYFRKKKVGMGNE